MAIPDDKTKTTLFLVTWHLRSLDSQVTEDRTSSSAPWFQRISSSQSGCRAPSKESALPVILLLSEDRGLTEKNVPIRPTALPKAHSPASGDPARGTGQKVSSSALQSGEPDTFPRPACGPGFCAHRVR